MSQVSRMIRLPVEASTLWSEIGSFSNIAQWHPMLADVESQGDWPGAVRLAHTRDGQTQIERLESIDPEEHVYRYTMEATVMPIENYRAEFRIEDNHDHSSTLCWSARFDVLDYSENAEAMVDAFLEAGIDNLHQRYGTRH